MGTPAFAQQPGSIRQVDFKTFRFPFNDAWATRAVETWEWLQDIPRDSVALTVNSVTYGDLTGDGREEAVVDAGLHYLYIYKEGSSGVELMGCLKSGARNVSVRANRLILAPLEGERVRPFEHDLAPAASADKSALVWVRLNKEVWTRNADGSNERKIFTCASNCRNPQFSPDRKSVFVIVDVSQDSGGVWKIDLAGETAVEFAPNVARFRMIQQGPYPGFVIANQLTLTESDGTPTAPFYAFFIYRPTGTRVGRIGGERDDPDVLLLEYSQ